jgi:hypothetical protein
VAKKKKKETRFDVVATWVCGGIFVAVAAHKAGILSQIWPLIAGAPGQVQQNLAALNPPKTPANLPDPSTPPLVAVAEAAEAAPTPTQKAAIAPPDAAKVDCKGHISSSVTPFSIADLTRFRNEIASNQKVEPNKTLSDVTAILGAPVCQLPQTVVKANHPFDRYRFIGEIDGQLIALVVGFQNNVVTARSFYPLN